MRDAAEAAAMSDPDRNRWFRRRWVEQEVGPAPMPLSTASPLTRDQDIEQLGRDLLQQWRREQAQAGGRRDD